MTDTERECLQRAIAALTFEQIENDRGADVLSETPLLNKSISFSLRQIEASLGPIGATQLNGIAQSIDEALLAIAEALQGS